MDVTILFLYLFSALSVASGAGVILAKNPVHAVLFLILAFFNAAGLFVIFGAEFLAMMLVVVYVGAVAVLFLFVVMMLDVDFAELKAGFIKNAPIGVLVGGIVLAELIFVLTARGLGFVGRTAMAGVPPTPANLTNTAALGELLYTRYVYLFEAASLVLIVAMVGAIVLTLRHKQGVKRQSVSNQVARTPKTGLEVVKIGSGEHRIPEEVL
jgi:NADH-quinone oxidoreductase subunit J